MEALGAMEDRLRVCKAKLKAKNKRIQSLQDELTEGGIRWDMQGDILDKMEQYSRRNSVRIQHLGWMENDNEECVALRYDYAKEHQITLTRNTLMCVIALARRCRSNKAYYCQIC